MDESVVSGSISYSLFIYEIYGIIFASIQERR
nr:MAG TPA: hypothetical protein [Caudoviricetes sp.]